MFRRVLLSLFAVWAFCMLSATTRAQSLYSNWYLAHSITNPVPNDYDHFADAVSGVGSDKVLIGASVDDTGAEDAGSAYLYDVNGTLLTTYTNPTPEATDWFGYAVSGVGAGRVLIGAHFDETGASDAGSAYLYDLNGTLLTTYTNPAPEVDDYFGGAVSGVGPDKVLIGAFGDNTGASGAGSAYLYDLNGTLLMTYTNPTPEVGDAFGTAVSGVGPDRVLIGAYGDNTGASGAGAAYLFDLNGTLLTTYTNPTPVVNDVVGGAVCGVGTNRVLIGAHGDNTGASEAGAAYLYDLDGTLLNTYTNPTPSYDLFGWALSGVGSDKVLIGAYYDDTGGPDSGSAYLYDLDGTLLKTFTNPTPDSLDRFGYAVSDVGRDRVLIGAYFDDTGASGTGSAYLYEVLPLLGIRPAPNPDYVRISWQPETGTNWVLQAVPNMLSTNWNNYPSGSTNPVDVLGSAPPRFFRLTKP